MFLIFSFEGRLSSRHKQAGILFICFIWFCFPLSHLRSNKDSVRQCPEVDWVACLGNKPIIHIQKNTAWATVIVGIRKKYSCHSDSQSCRVPPFLFSLATWSKEHLQDYQDVCHLFSSLLFWGPEVLLLFPKVPCLPTCAI